MQIPDISLTRLWLNRENMTKDRLRFKNPTRVEISFLASLQLVTDQVLVAFIPSLAQVAFKGSMCCPDWSDGSLRSSVQSFRSGCTKRLMLTQLVWVPKSTPTTAYYVVFMLP